MNRFFLFSLLAVAIITFEGCGLISGDATPGSSPSSETLQNGDIIFQTSLSLQSIPIQLATNSPYSHVGIVYHQEGKAYVFEAVQPVKSTPLEEWINRGKEGHYVVKRLKDASPLTEQSLAAMLEIGETWRGRSYDGKFQWTDDLLYCSELVWKLYDRGAGVELCAPSSVGDLELSDPKVLSLIKKRYPSGNYPKDEVIVTPADLFGCSLLKTVIEN